jgi:transposase
VDSDAARVGLWRAGFRPEGEVCALRALMRHRGELVQMAASHVPHRHKSLTQRNLQIQHVLSDLTGLTGLAIIDAILEGQRDPAELAKLRDPRVKAPPQVIEKSLVGHWRSEHLFTWKQSRRLYASYQQQIAECDTEIEQRVGTFPARVDPEGKPLPPDGQKKRHYHKNRKRRAPRQAPPPSLDLRTELYKLFGVDGTQIPGLELLGAAAIQRDRPGHVAVAHGVPFYFLAGAVPRQRHYRGTGAVARETPSP